MSTHRRLPHETVSAFVFCQRTAVQRLTYQLKHGKPTARTCLAIWVDCACACSFAGHCDGVPIQVCQQWCMHKVQQWAVLHVGSYVQHRPLLHLVHAPLLAHLYWYPIAMAGKGACAGTVHPYCQAGPCCGLAMFELISQPLDSRPLAEDKGRHRLMGQPSVGRHLLLSSP